MFWRKRKQSDFQAEVQSHLELEADQLAEEGITSDEAKHKARREFGNVVRAEERFYESSRWIWLEQLAQDLRYGLRTLRNNPGFTLVAVLSLALGIGANTAVFSLVDAVMLKSLPVRNPSELRILQWVRPHNGLEVSTSGYNVSDSETGELVCGSFSYAIYQMFRQNVPQFSDVVGYAHNNFTVTSNGTSEVASGQFVTGNYFTGLGTQPLIGRPILGDDDVRGRPRVAVLTYRYWEKRFGLDPGVIGKEILVNRTPVMVIGVMRPQFQGLFPGAAVDLFVPMNLVSEIGPRWFSLAETDNWWVQIFGRLRPGASEPAAAAALQATLAHAIEGFAPNAKTPRVLMRPGSRGVGLLRKGSADTLSVLTGVVGLVLLIACLNLANLLVARSAARRREMAVRMSIGAGTGRLVRQLLSESLLLAGIGAALGLLIAGPLLQILLHLVSQAEALGIDARIDIRALAFTFGIALFAALLFGTLPAWRATRLNLTPALKEGTSGMTGASARQRLNRVLVSAQVALSLLLLVGAALFVRTLMQLSAVDLGFRAERLLTFGTDAKQSGYHGQPLVDVYTRLQQNIGAIPGVESVALSEEGLMQGSESDTGVYVPGGKALHGFNSSLVLYCSPSFLSTMRIPILVGRDLTTGDGRVAVVNQLFVERYSSDSNPIGREFYLGDGKPPKPGDEPFRIVGVARNAHYTGVREELSPIAYIPYTSRKEDAYRMTFAIRTVLPPLSITRAVRRAVADIDTTIPVAEMKTEEQQVAESIGKERLFAGLVSAFGAVAALLAAIGLYGVMAYSVARRTVELGIRFALGARQSNVQWMVLRQSLWMVVFGLAIGIPAAVVSTRLIQKMLFGVEPTDVTSFVAAAMLMVAVGGLAAWIPARRASRIDPIRALRCE